MRYLRLCEDQNLEGLSITTAEGITVSLDKKSSTARAEELAQILGAIADSAVQVPGE